MPDPLAKLKQLAEKATPGPWFYSGYSGVFSAELVKGYDDEELSDCPSDRQCLTGPCPGCPYFEREYERGPLVAHVPAHHGDTATGRHAADGAFIAALVSASPALFDVVEAARQMDDAWDRFCDEDLDDFNSAPEAIGVLREKLTALCHLEADNGR